MSSPPPRLGDRPQELLAVHARLRRANFPIVSVVTGHTRLDARVWLARQMRSLNGDLILAPSINASDAVKVYHKLKRLHAAPGDELLLFSGSLRRTLPEAVAVVQSNAGIPVALATDAGDLLETLVDTETPEPLVAAALQGLTPIEPEERRILKAVAEQRETTPFLRGACEGVLYYMLEGRSETRGLFEANAQVQLENGRIYEIDIVSRNRRLAIEIDGPEHDALSGRLRDERKQADLKAANIEICRLTNAQILEDPVEVWRLIRDRL